MFKLSKFQDAFYGSITRISDFVKQGFPANLPEESNFATERRRLNLTFSIGLNVHNTAENSSINGSPDSQYDHHTNENLINTFVDTSARVVVDEASDEASERSNNREVEIDDSAAPSNEPPMRRGRKRKTSDMVLESIQALKKCRGVSPEDIKKYMSEHFDVNMRYFSHHVDNFLEKSVRSGLMRKQQKFTLVKYPSLS